MPEEQIYNKPAIVKTHDIHLDEDYCRWIIEVKKRFRNAQIKAAVKVNSEQLLFNWQLGRDLVIRKAEETWGSGIVEQVSLDLKAEFPDAKGFSTSNLWYMKKWYQFYRDGGGNEKLQELIGEIESELLTKEKRLSHIGVFTEDGKLQQVIGELAFPNIFAYVPWGHHIDIITKCKDLEEALFYIHHTILEGLSRNALNNYIKADFYHTAGRAITNFDEKLPAAQSRLAQSITKDIYDLSFISLPVDYDEKALEDALEENISRFLLELGTGFAFIGRQKEIVVAGKTRKIDLLFYHIRLRCYVVVELKVRSFEPEFTGKLNFYVNAVNELLCTTEDNPTIGLLICRDKDQTEVKWALQGITNPMGVASYDHVRIKEIQEQLPSDEQIRQRLDQAENEYNRNKNGAE